MKLLKLKISTKALLFFLVVSLLPLIAVSFVLVSSAHTQLLKAASNKQQIVASDLANKVDDYLSEKINLLVFQSKILAARNPTNAIDASQNLAVFMNQEKAVDSVSMLDNNGVELLRFTKRGQVENSVKPDESGTDAFKAVTYLRGKPFVSSVSYNKNNNPFITVAVPVLRSNIAQHLNDLSAASSGTFSSPDDLKGVLVANYNISDLWQSVLSTKIGHSGYAYVVDGLGNLVAHPNSKFLATHQKIAGVQAVQKYRNTNFGTGQTISELGQSVISTPRPLSKISWAVIVEEPVASIYSGINSYIRLSATVGISAILLSILIAIFFSRQLTGPIKKLSHGVKKLGAGELDQVVDIKSNDELQELANTFNSMSLNIKKLVSDLRANNINLNIEQTKLSRIINSVSDGVIALNARGEILSINPPASKLIDQEPTKLMGLKMEDCFALEQENKSFKPEITEPGLYHYADLTLAVGSKLSYLDLVVFVLDRKDSDVTTIITIRDLTQSRELEFMKLDFVAIAAHELRTPLTVVNGYLDLLNTGAIEQMTIYNVENLQKAIVGTSQLRNLISKLLNIARIERGEMEIFLEKIDLAKVVRENIHEHQTQAAQRLQRLTYISNTEKPVYVPADPSSITEVLNNLLGNAIKYTPEKGQITVNLIASKTDVRVEVLDNGPGVPENLRVRLFSKFYRAERSLIAGSRGTGLGLFISKTIIDLQGGEIGLKPDRGHGSTFYFTLPIYNPEIHDKLITKDDHKGGIHGWFKKRPDSRR